MPKPMLCSYAANVDCLRATEVESAAVAYDDDAGSLGSSATQCACMARWVCSEGFG